MRKSESRRVETHADRSDGGWAAARAMTKGVMNSRKWIRFVIALAALVAACSSEQMTLSEFIEQEFGDEPGYEDDCFAPRVLMEELPSEPADLRRDNLDDAQEVTVRKIVIDCLGGAPIGSEPSTAAERPPGDDPELDLLWGSCAGGQPEDCDKLYRESPVDSDYEEFGLRCGGRGYGDCAEVIAGDG
jgi:hypothetical protein